MSAMKPNRLTVHRRFTSPIGQPRWPWRFVTTTPADRPRLVVLNRYPHQVIGVAIRLPDEETIGGRVLHHQLSIVWARPAPWWVNGCDR